MKNQILGLIFCFIIVTSGHELLQLGTNIQVHTLDQLHEMDTSNLECSPELVQVGKSMDTWSEILENESQIEADQNNLKKVKVAISDYQTFGHQQIFLQIRTSLKATLEQLEQPTDFTDYQSWRKETSVSLEGELTQLDSAQNRNDEQFYCDRVEQLLDRLLKEREEVRKQCNQPKITINIINAKAKQVRSTQDRCQSVVSSSKEDTKTDLEIDAPETEAEANSAMAEVSESSEEREDDDSVDEDQISKKTESDFLKAEPVIQKENIDEKEDFKQYGYGFWARFLLGYPTRLPKGKDAPWYFVSRLTANKKDENINMGDRLLAIWLGKGYYHLATCDLPKGQANLVQNINYPEDIDGLWTYIYYSYSAEDKKAVAFILFGDDDTPKKAVSEVFNPPTKYLKFTIGGTDQNRYPGFNGMIRKIFFSAKEGVFIDNEQELLGKLQSMKRLPQSFMPELNTYKLVTSTITRDTNTNGIQQVVGIGKKQKIPHEYSFSGWFKWSNAKEQQDWHNAFRIQIATPSTDKFMGDRTLAMWVGKSDGGILHFATYSYTDMEGGGNPNLFKNVLHKDRHQNWHFVYFGYSKPEKQAHVYIKWSDSEDTIEYPQTKHFSVPKFYIFVGKDKQYPGYIGQIALAQFNIGEGAFRQGNDFKAKNDVFGVTAGLKRLLGKQPTDSDDKQESDENDGITQTSSSEDNKPQLEQNEESENDFQYYGYGYWARFLTIYPIRLQHGKNAPWYFMTRLTINKNYDNIRMGDRTLAIWQGQGYYHFTTCDQPSNQPNLAQNINYPVDIEGLWTYIYYSYSQPDKKAIAFVKYGTQEPRSILHAVEHPATKYLKLVLGGRDNNRYPGFNGMFNQVYFNTKESAFIDTIDEFNDHLKRTIIPQQDLQKLYRHEVVEDIISRQPKDQPDYDEVGGRKQKFPHEYSISGWFKWEPTQQQSWHNVFRVQINKPSTDKFLGDRTLSMWIGTTQNGILHFPTYSYTDMNGNGNANLVRNIQHQNRHMQWFFVYFGYSKNERKAFVACKFATGIETIEYNNVNHYYTPKFYVYTGKDQQFPGFNGKLGYVNFVLGEGSFRSTPNFKHPSDVFGHEEGETALLKKPIQKEQPKVDVNGEIPISSAVNENKPKVNKELKSQEPFQEYGYGFWAKFLTAYPIRLINGKNAPWYFMSRMTVNQNYDNIKMGDRTLAIWQGQGYYHFTTYNAANNQVNVVKNINYPNDIEGLWTYIYYSYSVVEKKATAFIKYGLTDPVNIDHAVSHSPTKYLLFVLGGKDKNRYPAFNGQFSSVVVSAIPGVYIGTVDKFNQFLQKQPNVLLNKQPSLSTNKLLDSKVVRQPNTAAIANTVEVQFPEEYAVSGWFKWEQPAQQANWHNGFRVQIKSPSTDKFMGDRTLAMWVGKNDGGVLHLTTYSYANMIGQGRNNLPQNIPHKDRHFEWFFVYQGYSRKDKQVYAYVKWTKSDDSLDFNNINHYFASKYFIFLGKDAHFQGFNGQLAYVSFNAGEGASKKGSDFTHPTDVFRFEKGTSNLLPKIDPTKPVKEEKGEMANAFNNNSPRVDKVLQNQDNLVEYGYGFWARFLTDYPIRLINGKNAPWYFISRMTVNQNYDNIRMGDRTLAIWQGQGYYHFTTCNIQNGQVNVIQNINYPADIEGLWTYIYYSYSVEKKQAVGMVKFGNEEPKKIVHSISHAPTKVVRFVLGGMDENRYPAFNGIFTKVVYSHQKGVFIDSFDQLKISHGTIPEVEALKNLKKLITKPIERAPTVSPIYEVMGDENSKLPSEYAFSGWFNWEPTTQQVWHNIFRVQIKSPSTDKFLGDRTLSCWLGTIQGGILHLPTYTYNNMNGGGNANVVQNIVHKNRHQKWFFVYFGYSKQEKHAYVYVKWTDSEDSLNYAGTNHYFTSKFYVFVGKDPHFPGFSGSLAYVTFQTGKGSFRNGKDFASEDDKFGLKAGNEELFKPIQPQAIPEPDKNVMESKSSEHSPKVDKKTAASNQEDLKEYGYGFWMRFLTTYPERLNAGKNQPWYFLSRLTVHQEYDNIRMGDRTLAIWQGQGYYHFTTCNIQNGQVNVIQNINYPDDIEGLWTYIYYSYSSQEQKAVAFIKYGQEEFKTIVHSVEHPKTKSVRFVLGGTDEKRYPGFNGLFTNVYFNDKAGAFINDVQKLNIFVAKQGGLPSNKVDELINKPIINDELIRLTNDEPIALRVAEPRLSHQYGISGWFRWTPTQQQPWHNIFRIQIKTPSTDSQLGDRTLTSWLGTTEGGILHFPTYTYTNMNGGGNSNYYKNIAHKDRIKEWFFVYFGYSKPQKQAYVYIKWSSTEDSLEYPDTNHYYSAEYFLFIGRDKHFPGFNGKLNKVQFNLGEGSFKKGTDFTHPKDVFGFSAGLEKYQKKEDAEPSAQADQKVYDNSQSQKEPAYDKGATAEETLKTYGYGFWMRFLTSYPERLLSGKNQPWYFVSRLTWHKEYDNIRMGDRALAIWQGQGYYHFTTCNQANGNVNVIQNINYPDDIEGLWTYVYYSYTDSNQAVAFIQYGNSEPKSITHQVTHLPTKFVRFVLGGSDEGRYPGFNGQFTRISFQFENAFISNVEKFRSYLSKVGKPSIDVKEMSSNSLLQDPIARTPDEEPTKQVVLGGKDLKFPLEYAISGWFKWRPVAQQPWHNIFRVQIKTPSTDQFLGDRTLSLWLGTPEGGILHFPTYSYSNMNGAGNVNYYKNIAHKNRHEDWFFTYFGYSKTEAKAFVYVKWSDSEETLIYDNVNHYLASEFIIFIGRDKHFKGFSGKLGFINFNIGNGAFSKDGFKEHPKDAFGFKSGVDKLAKSADSQVQPGQVIKDSLPNGFETKRPIVEKETSSDKDLEEYGYGFWTRYLTTYPQRLIGGKNAPWYFMARLTQHKEYDNIRMGDRTLAIWQGQGYYHFTTCNQANGNVNVIQNINYPEDIEGLWTYIYYSYSDDLTRAVGLIRFGNEEIKFIKHEVTHPRTKTLRFMLGGNDEGRYPGFNGVFTQITFSAQIGVYIDTPQQLKKYLDQNPQPAVGIDKLVNKKMVDDEIHRQPDAEPIYKVIGDEKEMFPQEYALSGWFKWSPTVQQPWHNIFRVQIKTPSTDQFLGDRTLTCWLGTTEGGILHFPTYTYSNMVGAGNANLYKNIAHKDRHIKWFFVYFGYSKTNASAYVYVKWMDSEDSLTYDKTNHYWTPEFYVFIGKDKHFPGFSGILGHINFNLGKGSFKKGTDYKDEKDSFGLAVGIEKLVNKKQIGFKPTDPNPAVHDSDTNNEKPVADKQAQTEKFLEEYGYGFWARYLTAYPQRMLSGKNQAWYFVARLTQHKEYDNIRMGDRTLAIWQGQGYYHFTTCNIATNNVNQIQNINYPPDIEGVWTYIYYSYSSEAKKAVAFIKYGTADLQTITHQTSHQVTKYVRFVLGGTDEKRYPGFNGLFASVTFSAQAGAFLDSAQQLNEFLWKHPAPKVIIPLTTKDIVQNEVNRQPNDEPAILTAGGKDEKFPEEYGISGWFKWKPTAQQPWHNLFRVQIKTPSTDSYLGDRTLSLWLGTPEGGILHFPTYTYTNMNGGGNANYYKNIPHKERHLEWFYVYFGYSKQASKASVYVKWSNSEDSLNYGDTNHYVAPEFFIFVGKDKHFPGHSGKLAYVSFSLGEGAFVKDSKFDHPKDAFGFQKGNDALLKTVEPKLDLGQASKDALPNAFDSKKPVIDNKAESDSNLVEYGYGFWARFLTVYPQRLISGKNQPWYFVARLTQHKEYDNIRMGDRTLAIWQGQGYYHFTTCNAVNGNVNVIQNIDYPADIEGVWTYIYYSYSDDKSRALGFIKYGNADFKSIRHDVTHPNTKFVRFVLGGNDEGRYPGFNGVFTQVNFSKERGAFIEYVEKLNEVLTKLGTPSIQLTEMFTHKLMEDETFRQPDAEPLYKVIGEEKQMFPQEYALSGWFKWSPTVQQPWHNIFRVQIKTPSTDQFLGDRTLTCWLGTPEGGILHFPTYTYSNMVGAGNANLYKNIVHKNRHTKWFFVYYGYSKKESSAYVYVKWSDSQDFLVYENVNHYLVPEFYIFVGKDKHFPGLNGKLGYINFNVGKGVFQKSTDFTHPKDVFAFHAGFDKVSKQVDVGFKPSEADKGIHENAFNQAKPVLDREAPAERVYEQYGYGFWARYLTVYPQRMLAGKNEAWYFVARLTQHKEYDNIRMGDRTLAIWQGQGYYHFTTCNIATNNVNQIQNINYPADIEGVWTYIYYSYSTDASKAVAFIKYGSDKIQSITHATSHAMTKYLRFILGGNDEKRYPGFNGLFTQVTFSTSIGAYVDQEGQLNKYLEANPAPSTVVSLKNNLIVDDKITRKVTDEPIEKSIGKDDKFPSEYAISGWFKWQEVPQQPWHNIFRVSLKTPSTDQYLGDRTLTCWLGAGILHFPTYTYTNMNGAGNANYHKNLDHKNRHLRWFFVYFGYSKKLHLANIFVKWQDAEDILVYEAINHYFAPEFFIYVGRDKHFPGFNGQLGQVNFNAGDGSFKKNNDVKDKKNIFGFEAPFAKKAAQPFDLKERDTKLLVSSNDQKTPTIEKTFAGEDASDISQYGYGFWCRFLNNYPQQLLGGIKVDWQFMARVTKNTQLADAGLGDRTLALWLGRGFYHFTTYHGGNPNAVNNINHPADIEGLWTFIYHSHCLDKKQSVAFVKFGADKLIKNVQVADHKPPVYLKFYLGGAHLSYKGFNGQFSDVIFSINHGIFADTEAQITLLLKTLKQPQDYNTHAESKIVIEKDELFDAKTELKEIVYDDLPLVGEYAWSGWFKWTPTVQQPWHLAIRLAINKNSQNIQFMGDRTLCMWIGNFQGGLMHFATYSYANMYGGGNVNSVQNILYKDDLVKWHFVYFGYSKAKKFALANVEFKSRKEHLEYKDHNHYLPNTFSLYMGRDKWHAIYSGYIAYFRFNAGQGAFATDHYDKSKEDIFGYSSGKGSLIKPTFMFDLKKSIENRFFDSPQDQKESVFMRKASSIELEDVEQYGYGFWCRFLTHYPKQLMKGLQNDWSFMARLTKNEKFGDAGLGDRTLALWLGRGFYHFTTYDGGNVNKVHNINHPADIEGLWTFIYHSHSIAEKQSIAMIKFGNDKVKKGVVPAQHSAPSFLQFMIGGNNMNYAAFNGQFKDVIYSSGMGVFIKSEADIDKLLIGLSKPADFNGKQTNKVLVNKLQAYKPEISQKEEIISDAPLEQEYAWSGWFKWAPCAQQPWHLMVRLSILQSSENISYLGDRTLNAWVGAGYFHFTSYSYANIYGAGNVNQWQNLNYEGDHLNWHFIYFGYSRVERLAYARVEFNGRLGELNFKGTNHYLPKTYSLYVGKDKWHTTYSGNIAYLNFNAGPGAFGKEKHEEAPKDIFGYKAGKLAFPAPKAPEVDPLRKQEYLDSAFNGKEVINLEFNKDELGDLDEYGYGFYVRYLQEYPTQLVYGKQAPWYAVSRMTYNKAYGNIGMGDRLLALWQGINIYAFATIDKPSGNVNHVSVVPSGDIDGVWTFFYMSYSLKKTMAVFITKYDNNNEIFHREHRVNHGKVNYLRVIFGGKDAWYPGLNGQYANYAIKFGETAFVQKYDEFKRFLDNRIPHPTADIQKLQSIDVLKEVKSYTSQQQEDEILEISDEARFKEEYSVSGWVKCEVSPLPPWYVVFRLTQWAPEVNTFAQYMFNGFTLYKHAVIYRFHSYTYHNMMGASNPWVYWDANLGDQQYFWHFVYMGYNRKTRQLYQYISLMENEQQQLIPNVNQVLLGKHYFSLGRDFKKHFGYYRGIQAKLDLFRLNYGTGSFRLKPLGADKKLPDLFLYDKGRQAHVPKFDLKTIQQDEKKLLEAKFNEPEPLIDWQIKDEEDGHTIAGLKEYSWSLWSRWSRTAPINMPFRQSWHNLARLTNQKNHRDLSVPGDRTLAVWVGWGFYYFTAYSIGVPERVTNIKYKVIDGEWNFITFSYKKGQAKGVVVFGGKDAQEVNLDVTQAMVVDYLRFVVGKEFGYQFFNGHIYNPQLNLGDDAFITKDKAKELAVGELKIPDEFQYKQTRKSVELLREKTKINTGDDSKEIIIEPDVAQGKKEYAISGWARWTEYGGNPPWHLLYRVSIFDKATAGNADKPGDTTMNIFKGHGYFHVTSYTVDEFNGGNWNTWQNVDYQGTLHKNWVFFYQGYSRDKQKMHACIKFPTHEAHLNWDKNQFVPNLFRIELHKDKWYPGYNGFMEAWYFNLGDGAYKESNYGKDESEGMTFGFGGRTITPLKQWKSDEMIESVWGGERKVGMEVIYEDDSINGLTEYGYGFWSRFGWNGPEKLINKPAWMALSRLSLNENYGDAGAVGDRCLAIWVGSPFYHFTTSTPGNVNVWTNVNYEIMLDGQWNYIYYGYKKLAGGGKAIGHILFNGQILRSTNLPTVNHPPVQDYLYLAVGSSGKRLIANYYSFNGHLATFKLVLGEGGLISSVDDLRKLAGNHPDYPKLKTIKETILEEQIPMKRGEGQVDPKEFKDEFDQAEEYSVSLWYKWSTIGRVAWENIYTLSYNEPNIRTNHGRPGDRQLSMFQYADHRTFFSSYTTSGSHDSFNPIYSECPVVGPDQTSWVYAYYGYSRSKTTIFGFLKTRNAQCERKLSAMHRVPKYLGLYVGKDGIHTPYNGKFAHMYLFAGPGSFRMVDFLSFEPYVAGAVGIVSKPYIWDEKKEQFETAFDGTFEQEFDGDLVEGHTSYAIGVWTRYLTAIPKRLMTKGNQAIIRLTNLEKNTDAQRIGDRLLTLLLMPGQYGFRTHNTINNKPNLGLDINYKDQLEGVWNFLYFSYSASRQKAVAFVKFGQTGVVERLSLDNILHKPMDSYAKIIFGKQFAYQGFQGQVNGLQVLFGGPAYVADVDSLEKMIKNIFKQPEIDEPGAVSVNIQKDLKVKALNDPPQITEWADEFEGVLEYSIFGWFRYSNPKLARDNNVFLRLSNNEKAYRKESGQIGDRTLLIMLQPREVVFATYTMGTVDRGLQHNIRKPTLYNDNFGLWTYVWFGYSWLKKEAGGVAKFPSNTATVPYPNVLHMIPKYFAMFAGSDGYLGGWIGQMQKVGAIFGKGAYIDIKKGNFMNLLPDVTDISSPSYIWEPEKNDILLAPLNDGKPLYDLKFDEQVGGMRDYGYGLWTRWLMTTPDRINDKSPFHQLVRLTNTEKYEDNSQLGNRVLATWVGKGYYHFTTYDIATNKVSIGQNTNYDDYLEGHWNYIYFSYTSKDQPRAVGFVYFGDLKNQIVNRIEILNARHNPLNGYARVVVANKEFGYPAFNGMIYDLNIIFGKGFIGSKEQFIKEVLQSSPKPQLKLPDRTDLNVLRDQKNFEKNDDKAPVKAEYDQFQGVVEYAVSGWIQPRKTMEDALKSIFRLTINKPGYQLDKRNAGDRTLSAFLSPNEYIFSTYDYGDLDSLDDDQNDLTKSFKIGEEKGDWVYLYFGYNLKQRKAYCYTRYYGRQDGYQFMDLKHFIPNHFWFYLGNDGFYAQFQGIMFNWNLHMGDGAFTLKPKDMIELWPFEPAEEGEKVMSALLGNQGLSSVKLLKGQPLSGGLDRSTGPLSGQLDQAGGVKSGQLDKSDDKPESGEVQGQIKAKSGDIKDGDKIKSGDIKSGDKAKSGDIKK